MTSISEHQAVLFELLKEFDRVCRKLNIRYLLFAGTMLGAVRHQDFIPWDDDLDVVMLRGDYKRFMDLAPGELNPDKYFLQIEYTDHWPMFFSKLRKNNTTCLEKFHPNDKQTHQGIYIDIFPCDNASNYSFIRRLQFYSSKIVIAKSLYKRGYETGNNLLKKLFMQMTKTCPLKLFHRFTIGGNINSRYVHTFFGGTSKYEKGVYPREWFLDEIYFPFHGDEFPVSVHYDQLLTKLYGDYMTIPPEEDRKCKIHAILVDTGHPYTEYEHYRDDITFDVHTRSIR